MNMRLLGAIALPALAFTAPPAFAQDASSHDTTTTSSHGMDMADWRDQPAPLGVYAGAAFAQSRYRSEDFSVDNKDNSWKGYIGGRLHKYFGVEADYVDFGKARAPATALGTPVSGEAKGAALYAVGFLPAPWVDVFAKAGASRLDTRRTGDLFSSEKKTQFTWGAGVQARLSRVAIRAEWERFDTNLVGNLNMVSIGANYTFGPRS